VTESPPLRSYGRTKARPLSGRQERLLRELLPKLRLPLGAAAPVPLPRLFSEAVDDVWLEIGFGSGEHIVWQAEHHPRIGFIGCEPFLNGVASLAGKIEALSLGRILVHDGDARDILPWLPPASIGRVFVLFPDPWPKKRHAKRRLLTDATVAEFARILRRGGELRFASDSGDYASEALLALTASRAFEWTACRAEDWRKRPADWPETRYEAKALREAREPAYLTFRRV
jgi:tRNA (guanine-N7-)-methyltransferase